jgi:tripartite-type tricarboxylate transporter receptor subunit TctC
MAGQLRALAVTSLSRWEAMPSVPTLNETVAGYEVIGWNGVGAPKSTSIGIIDRLNPEINAGLASPNMKARFGDLSATSLAGTPADFGKLIAEDTEKWAKVAGFAGIKPE